MDTEMQIFENERFGRVRVVIHDGDPWFLAVDVCTALEISNPSDALRRLDDDEKALVSIEGLSRGNAMGNIVSEPGLYTLVLGSRKPEAKIFKRWITHEVIPSIRKHGAYMTDSVLDQVLSHPDTIYSLAETLLKERNERVKLQQRLNAEQPKIDYVDNCVDPMGSTNIRNTAKELGIPQNLFVSQLLKYQFLYRDRTGKLLPFADKAKKGYFIVKDAHTQYGQSVPQTFVTVLGKQYLIQYFKTKGVF